MGICRRFGFLVYFCSRLVAFWHSRFSGFRLNDALNKIRGPRTLGFEVSTARVQGPELLQVAETKP